MAMRNDFWSAATKALTAIDVPRQTQRPMINRLSG
jgi:hypothetical protein